MRFQDFISPSARAAVVVDPSCEINFARAVKAEILIAAGKTFYEYVSDIAGSAEAK